MNLKIITYIFILNFSYAANGAIKINTKDSIENNQKQNINNQKIQFKNNVDKKIEPLAIVTAALYIAGTISIIIDHKPGGILPSEGIILGFLLYGLSIIFSLFSITKFQKKKNKGKFKGKILLAPPLLYLAINVLAGIIGGIYSLLTK